MEYQATTLGHTSDRMLSGRVHQPNAQREGAPMERVRGVTMVLALLLTRPSGRAVVELVGHNRKCAGDDLE
jgi:hypothetical protein